MMIEYRVEIWQDGMMVAAASGHDRDQILMEGTHYAMMYGQDGPVDVRYSTHHQSAEPAPVPSHEGCPPVAEDAK